MTFEEVLGELQPAAPSAKDRDRPAWWDYRAAAWMGQERTESKLTDNGSVGHPGCPICIINAWSDLRDLIYVLVLALLLYMMHSNNNNNYNYYDVNY